MLKENDVVKVLSRLNISTRSTTNNEQSGLCPGHLKTTGRPDNTPSWSINEETGLHHCFSCGYKGNLLSLVCDILGYSSYDEAKEWLGTIGQMDLEEIISSMKSVGKYQYLPSPVPMSEARLAVFSHVPNEVLAVRGISGYAANIYKLRWEASNQRYIIPIRGEGGALLGWQEKGTTDRFFKNRPPGIKKANELFGLYEARTTLLTSPPVRRSVAIVVESPLDVVRLASLGAYQYGEFGVAVYGSNVSVEQIKHLRQFDRVMLALDNDEAGVACTKQAVELLLQYGIEFSYFNYDETDKKDIGDMSLEEIKWGREHAVHMAFGARYT
jgi:DNA primase